MHSTTLVVPDFVVLGVVAFQFWQASSGSWQSDMAAAILDVIADIEDIT